MATEKQGKSGSKSGGGLTLRGRFTPGSEVRLTKASGPGQVRPGPADEVVDTATVDDDGTLEFSGTEPGERYFASGQVQGQPVEVRLTGRADSDDSLLSGYEPVAPERQKLADGSWLDEPREREDYDDLPEGTTWRAQDQVSGLQRSDTARGAATPISQAEQDAMRRNYKREGDQATDKPKTDEKEN